MMNHDWERTSPTIEEQSPYVKSTVTWRCRRCRVECRNFTSATNKRKKPVCRRPNHKDMSSNNVIDDCDIQLVHSIQAE